MASASVIGAYGLMVMLAGIFTETPAVFAFRLVMVIIHIDRLRQDDKEQDDEQIY